MVAKVLRACFLASCPTGPCMSESREIGAREEDGSKPPANLHDTKRIYILLRGLCLVFVPSLVNIR